MLNSLSKWILEERFYHKTANTDYIYDPAWSRSAKHPSWQVPLWYYQLYSHVAVLMKLDVFTLAPACKLDTLLTVLTSLQTQHRGLKGWMSHNSRQQQNNKTGASKMSPLRFNSSIFTASSCPHWLSVSAWLNSITPHAMEIQGKTDSCDICLETCVMSGVSLW